MRWVLAGATALTLLTSSCGVRPGDINARIIASCVDYCMAQEVCVEPILGPAWNFDMCVDGCEVDHIPGTTECHDAGVAYHQCYLGLDCTKALMPLIQTSCATQFTTASSLCGY